MTRTRRAAAALGGATAVATAALVAASVVGPAGATDDSGSGSGSGSDSTESDDRRAPIDELRACMEDQGVTLPERGAGRAWGGDADPLSEDERDALRAAAEECGLPAPGAFGRPPGVHARGSEEDRAARHEAMAQCVEEQGSTLPARPDEPGDARPELSDEQRAALETCADELGLPAFGGVVPGFRGRHGGPWGHGMGPCAPESEEGTQSGGSETDDGPAEGSFWEA